ncbi:MAG: DUF4328 domain-containing protein [Acidimicrobiia bacterium]
MTIIACPECGRQISDQDPSCPHCGYPLAAETPADDPSHRSASTESVDLGLSKVTSASLWATAGLYVIAAGAFIWYLFVWNEWAGQRSPSAAATQNALDAETLAFGFLGIGFIGYAITGVLFAVWFFKAYRAAASRGATGRTWASGWTIGGWFIPLANFVIPKLVMNEVDRMSNPEAGDPPIEERWRPLPRLEASDMWWALFVLGSLSTAIGSNWQTYIDVTNATPSTATVSGYATATVILACGLVAIAGSGVAGARMVRSIGERLHTSQPTFYSVPGSVGGQPQGTIHATNGQTWIRGYDWTSHDEQTVRCLSCDKDVSFPREQRRHNTHRIAAPRPPVSD